MHISILKRFIRYAYIVSMALLERFNNVNTKRYKRTALSVRQTLYSVTRFTCASATRQSRSFQDFYRVWSSDSNVQRYKYARTKSNIRRRKKRKLVAENGPGIRAERAPNVCSGVSRWKTRAHTRVRTRRDHIRAARIKNTCVRITR